MAVGIPTGFVRKLYRILDHESAAIIAWDADGASFSIHDSAALDAQVLPRYFRGRISAFRQQLLDHGFARCDCEEDEAREQYRHADFLKGQPGRLSRIERRPKRKSKGAEAPKPAHNSFSLKVTLTVPPREGRKRERTQLQEQQQQQQQPIKRPKPAVARNPLFSDEPEPSIMSLAKFVEGAGLLPASSELPDPISYLSKAAGQSSVAAPAAPQETTAEGAPSTAPMFSDDMVKSTLFFLLSPSCTGVEANAAGAAATVPATAAAAAAPAPAPASAAPPLATAMTTSTTSFLASLLASSSTGGVTATPFARGNNPLFSDQATDGDDDSIWNILVSSSVDRVRSAIGGVQSPQEKLRLILEEREKLEEQRKKVGAPAGPIMPRVPAHNAEQASAAMENSRQQKQQNPLFSTEPALETRSGGQREPAEDDLWKLLMSSSIDSFRRVSDLGL